MGVTMAAMLPRIMVKALSRVVIVVIGDGQGGGHADLLPIRLGTMVGVSIGATLSRIGNGSRYA